MSFDVFSNNKLKTLTQLQDPELLLKILIEIDKKFFENVALSIDENKKVHNLQEILKAIRQFYASKDLDIDEDKIDINGVITAYECDQEYLIPIAELIIAMTTLSEDNPRYIKIMESMNSEDKNILFEILSEKLPSKSNEPEKEYDKDNSINEREIEEHNNLLLRLDSVEKENQELSIANQQLTFQNDELRSQIVQINQNYFDLESKYNEIVSEMEYKNEKNNKEYEDTVSLSIQLSEIKGKLDAREMTIVKLKDEKEKILGEFNQKIQTLRLENESLKEKSLKYDLLKEKLEKYDAKIEELNNLKSKNNQNEKLIKDQDEKIKKLKSFVDTDKSKLLKRIEELNFQIAQGNEKIVEYRKEIEIYKENIINKENEINNFKKQVECYKSNEIITEIEKLESNLEKKSTLVEIEEQNDIKKQKLELETKYRILHEENVSLIKLKCEMEEKMRNLEAENEELKAEKEKFLKKVEKNAKYKEEKRKYINKIDDLTSQLRDLDKLKIEHENLKLQNLKEMNELESKFNTLNFQNSQKYNEEVSKLKEKLSSVEHELNFLKRENKRLEENLDNTKHLESQKKSQHENALVLERLKEISMDENKELKKSLSEKTEIIIKLTEINKHYESQFKEFQEKIMKLDQKQREFSIEELKKKDELIQFYKISLENTEKSMEEQEHFMTKMFYELAVNYMNMKNELGLLSAKEIPNL